MNIKLFALIAAGLTSATVAIAPMAGAQEAPTDYSYLGVGVGVGDLGPDSDVGLAINSKLRVANQVSLRPSVISDLNFDDDNSNTQLSLPITYDFNSPTENGRLLPFIGAGVTYSTGSEDIAPMATAGIDYRVSRRVTINGTVNANFYDDTSVNGIVGLGYTF